ncbi:phosphotransferase family protein [Sporomusa termitida]|uniref:Methylthioribose kinase n=1 Tax=Sporomusa termitida TaxID=2377 RepID=A0A517DYM2_9FIRM|nr:aminoglycoside phosphotransferase family protein [Sporomusa termitida]QDR82474.1 Methylthioribose kinase [Sporomusa termitida]
MINIADRKVFAEYLLQKNLISDADSTEIEQLGGGVSCEAIMVRSPQLSFVVKQALPKLRVKEDWFSDVSRIVTEKDCLAFYNQVVPQATPKLLFYDEENYLYGMEAAPAGSEMWKKQLLNGRIDYAVAGKAALALANVHNVAAGDKIIKNRFASKKFFIELRIDPYLRSIAKRHPALSAIIDQETNRLLATQATLVHGDYSPKNILVNGQQIFILDFEVAHIGDPSFDLGFLTNHFLLKAVKNKQWALSYLNLALYTAEVYLQKINFMDAGLLERNTVKTLALLFLSRVDGKSPAEYITAGSDQDSIRKISYYLLQNDVQTYRSLIRYVGQELKIMT